MKQHANGQALRQADNIKEKDANVYLTHTLAIYCMLFYFGHGILYLQRGGRRL